MIIHQIHHHFFKVSSLWSGLQLFLESGCQMFFSPTSMNVLLWTGRIGNIKFYYHHKQNGRSREIACFNLNLMSFNVDVSGVSRVYFVLKQVNKDGTVGAVCSDWLKVRRADQRWPACRRKKFYDPLVRIICWTRKRRAFNLIKPCASLWS